MPHPVWDRLSALSEDEFRKAVLIPLLAETDGIDQVTDVHGTSERGLDIVFCTSDPVRKQIWYGLQLKKGDISGGGSRKQTVQEIITQLGLASGFRHKVAVGKAGEYAMDIYIVACSGKISQTAREEIATRMNPLQVEFWDLAKIIGKAKDVMPELLQVADGEAVTYLKRLAGEVDRLDALDQVSGVADRKLSEVFVDPTVRRRVDPNVSEARTAGPGTPAVAATDVGFLDHSIVLIGEQNEGKTSILRMIALKAATAILSGSTDDPSAARVPLMIRATDVVRLGSVSSAASSAFSRLGASSHADAITENPEQLARYLILLDGFSELQNEEDKITCASLVADESNDEGPRYVITARPDDFLAPRHFASQHHYTISPFSSKDVAKLVRSWVKDHPVEDVPARLVERVRDALQLPGSPIPAIIGVMMYEKEQRFITNTADAVDRYMVIRLGRYASEMGLPFKVDWSRKQDLLAELAFSMVQQEAVSVGRAVAEEQFGSTYARLGERNLAVVALQELIDAGVLLESSGEVSFFRSAFRDFFAAHHLLNSPQEFDGFFEEKLFDRKWGHVLVFAAGLRRKNTKLLTRLNEKVNQERDQLSVADREDYLYGAYLLGRILSNSEFSDAPPRLSVLRTTTAAAKESADLLAVEAVKQFGPIGNVVSLVGIEQTLFVSIGVPWLEKQIGDLAADETMDEEERYLLASVYSQMGCEGWADSLLSVSKGAKSPRVVAALTVAAHMIESQRTIPPDATEAWRGFKLELERGRKRLGKAFEAAFELKHRLLEIERDRVRRLTNQSKGSKKGG